MIADCTAVILTGGDSRRMGQDKASLKLGEQSLLQHVISVVLPLFSAVIISVRQSREEITLSQVFDDPKHRGPLAGLAAGLQNVQTPWVFAVACDMPFIEQAVIQRLGQFREGYQAVVPMVKGYPQPLAAFYSAGCLGAVLECLNGDGKHSLRELLDKLQVRYVSEDELQIAGSQSRSFVDLDTPEEVASAMQKL
ncbi:MAG: molybdenum cofactor guanylyltransferase [Sideroxydans sp.]|nr:molybdenum cofactor guanylyltransferase [Sideroxydans sp.]